jgi:hypothetical protein
VEIHAHVPKAGNTAVHWLLEGALIVVSVLLAFAVGQYRESRANRELAGRVLEGLRQELEFNLSALEPQVAFHQRWLTALDERPDSDGETARDVFLATWPDLNPQDIKPPFVSLRRGAWDAALSSGALRLVDYSLVAHLSEIYQSQQELQAAVDKLGYTSTAFFDPSMRKASVQQFAFQLDAVRIAEGFLVSAYQQYLPEIQRAAHR